MLPPAEDNNSFLSDTRLQINVWAFKLLSPANESAIVLTDTCDAQMGFLQNEMLGFSKYPKYNSTQDTYVCTNTHRHTHTGCEMKPL